MGKKPLNKDQIKKIVELRKCGYSLPEIKQATRHGSATIFKYIKNVEILPKFLERWENRKKSSVVRMEKNRERARKKAESVVKSISQKDKVLIATCLYWAEGNKKDFSLSNTDPLLIKTFIECLYEIGIKVNDIKISIRIYEDINQSEACKFWAKVVGIPVNKIGSVNILEGKKRGKLKYGMCRVRVARGSNYLKLIESIKSIIDENISSP